MRRVNLSDPELRFDPTDPPGFRAGMFRFGPLLGATQLGATLYELPPGETLCPYHYEYAEEEWLLVLAGRATVRHPEGSDELAPWDAVCFPTGPAGAHQVRNDSPEPVRVLMWSSVVYPAATAYPDSGKVGLWTGDAAEDHMSRRADAVDYYDGER